MVIAADFSGRPEVDQFIGEMVREHGFDESALEFVFENARYKQSIVDAMTRPAEKTLTWKEYRKIFLTSKRVSEGKKFIQQYRDILSEAEQVYGVPVSVIAAVIGVETYYGQRMGNYRVIDALSTLSFDYPPRSAFFRGQLKEFLILSREENQNELQLLGSYAGAMGYGQFIPSSYRSFAIDFDADGIRDIWANPADAIGSVANYLSEHNWLPDQPVADQLENVSTQAKSLFGGKLKPHVSVEDLNQNGIRVDAKISAGSQVSPLLFQGSEGAEYWLGYDNFYVITRYNHSKLYAMAVYQLSLELM
jgi:membrane-bound lytic murein transglycosylase B